MSWPDGILAGLELAGRARDLRTGPDGRPEVIEQADLLARTGLDRTVQSISSPAPGPAADGQRASDGGPAGGAEHEAAAWAGAGPTGRVSPDLGPLVGARAGGNLRGALARTVPDLRAAGAPLYLLLDDLAGASLIAGFVWSQWRERLPDLQGLIGRIPMRSMQGICSGFRPGASSLKPDGTQSFIPHQVAAVPPLVDPADPIGWHDQSDRPAMAMRRARRIDVWSEDGEIRIDAMFRDSCWRPDGVEIAVHEYEVFAAADPVERRLRSVAAVPRVLPYDECPLAAPNVELLSGVPLADLREEVLNRLRGTLGCTHLNDALRALAEVPVLAAALDQPASLERPARL